MNLAKSSRYIFRQSTGLPYHELSLKIFSEMEVSNVAKAKNIITQGSPEFCPEGRLKA
jgi:hypothetical protein